MRNGSVDAKAFHMLVKSNGTLAGRDPKFGASSIGWLVFWSIDLFQLFENPEKGFDFLPKQRI